MKWVLFPFEDILHSCNGPGQWFFSQGVLLIGVTDRKSRCLGAGS